MLTAIVVACSGMSVGAFLLDAWGLLAMPFTISAVSLPGLIATVGISVWAGRVGRDPFLRRLYVGVVAGVLATLAYDGLRGAIMAATPGSFDPFRSHPNFGALILDTSPHTTAATAVGWIYHFWNGISFAVIYAMIAGGARFYWAFLWAMALETATVGVYPNVFGISRTDSMFIAVSFAGHAVYGTTMGILCRNWLAERPRRSVWALALPTLRRGLS